MMGSGRMGTQLNKRTVIAGNEALDVYCCNAARSILIAGCQAKCHCYNIPVFGPQ